MKPLGNSDSLGALMSMGPSTEDEKGHAYGRGFETMLEGVEEEGSVEEYSGHVAEKKRRLSVDQVKALEKNFEVENKLEPERKMKLAQQLGLQPRQVAVWFQNRRARWKTKQLERDYNILKANFDALKHSYDSLQRENEALLSEIQGLKSRLHEENTETESDESDKKAVCVGGGGGAAEANLKSFNGGDGAATGASVFADFRDGLSDSDSSAILNEDNNPSAAAMSSDGILQNQSFMVSSAIKFNCSSPSPSSMNCFQYSESKAVLGDAQNFQPQFVKMEEHNFFGGDEPCNFFSDDQAPTLQWYCTADQWNP